MQLGWAEQLEVKVTLPRIENSSTTEGSSNDQANNSTSRQLFCGPDMLQKSVCIY